MKRKLNEQEMEIATKNADLIKKKVDALSSNLDYNYALQEHNKTLRDFDDTWRPYLRTRKEDDENAILDSIEKELKFEQEKLDILTKQIHEGVAEKQPSGVN